MKLTIAWLYPDLMSTYGDRGNIICLNKRCEWRGIQADVLPITLETSPSALPTSDLIFMGGAQDRQQKLAGEDFLKHKGPVIKQMVEKGIPALFVCAAYQFVGHYYKPYQGANIPGAGIFDLYTEHPGDQAKRLIGNIVAELINPNELMGKTIVGFENHGGRTYIGKKENGKRKTDRDRSKNILNSGDSITRPFARIIRGFGNNGKDGFEGAVYKNAIGSYFHGPFLPKNPHIADWLITKALELKYKQTIALKPLDDTLENHAHDFIIANKG